MAHLFGLTNLSKLMYNGFEGKDLNTVQTKLKIIEEPIKSTSFVAKVTPTLGARSNSPK
jgi:hypothetical protein